MTFSDLEKFTQDIGSKLTTYPVNLKIDSSLHYSKEGCVVLAYICRNQLNKNDIDSYTIYIPECVYKIYSDREDVLRRLICHELAHIIWWDHSGNFEKAARELGAGYFSTKGQHTLTTNNIFVIKCMTALGLGHLLRSPYVDRSEM